MTKRKATQKGSSTATPTTSQKVPKQSVEAIKQESNTKVAPKAKTPTTASQKATAKPRGRPKKVKVDKPTETVGRLVRKAADVKSPVITYVAENRAILVADKPQSLYDRFVSWLTYKLYYYTSFFRGY